MKEPTQWESLVRKLATEQTMGGLCALQKEAQAMLAAPSPQAPPDEPTMTDEEKIQTIAVLGSLGGFLPYWLIWPVLRWVIAQPSRARTF